jgi:uncharacterized protein (TIGR02996 family)
MDQHEALLAAILDSPDDDLPRLIYADWLEESGRPFRAEFIRLQLDLARLPGDDRRRPELEQRERALLRKHERAWLGPLRAWLGGWQFRRGLVEAVTLKARTLLKQAGTLFRLAPVRHAEVRHADGFGHALAECPLLSRLTSLRVRGFHAADAAHLIASAHLDNLTSLGLAEAGLQDRGVEALATSPLLAQLAELDLTCNSLHDEGIVALAESPNASRLESLDLSRNDIGEAGAVALAQSVGLAGLRWLSLDGHGPGRQGRQMLQERFGDRVRFS